jgi:hypothetical protein
MTMTDKPPAKPAAPKPVPPGDAPVLEQPQHPFEEFMAREFANLIERMNKEGDRLKVHPLARVKVLVIMLTIRVAAFGVRAGIARADIIKVLDQYLALQPKPAARK